MNTSAIIIGGSNIILLCGGFAICLKIAMKDKNKL